MVLGISPALEGEEMRSMSQAFAAATVPKSSLPKAQEDLLKDVFTRRAKPVVLVLLNGSAVVRQLGQTRMSPPLSKPGIPVKRAEQLSLMCCSAITIQRDGFPSPSTNPSINCRHSKTTGCRGALIAISKASRSILSVSV